MIHDLLILERTPAKGKHGVSPLCQSHQDLPLHHSDSLFAAPLEYLRYRELLILSDLIIKISKPDLQFPGQTMADGGLAGTHHATEEKGSVGLPFVVIRYRVRHGYILFQSTFKDVLSNTFYNRRRSSSSRECLFRHHHLHLLRFDAHPPCRGPFRFRHILPFSHDNRYQRGASKSGVPGGPGGGRKQYLTGGIPAAVLHPDNHM